MSRDFILLISCLLLSTLGAWWSRPHVETFPDETFQREVLSKTVVVDASGHRIPSADYQRIVCGSSIAALVLPKLISPSRVVMVSQHFMEQSPQSFLLQHAETLDTLDSVETMVAIKPDLVIVNSLGHKPERLERLREKGLVVIDLGKMLGWSSLQRNILDLGKVLHKENEAQGLAMGLERRLNRVAANIKEDSKVSALWVSVYSGQIYGGTVGSSYHDLLRFSGLKDRGKDVFTFPWPSIPLEQLLSLNPEVIVTDAGRSADLLALPGSEHLRAAQNQRIIEMPKGTDTTGPQLLEACEFLFDAVYNSNKDNTLE